MSIPSPEAPIIIASFHFFIRSLLQGAMASLKMLFEVSGITFSGSTPKVLPNPSQVGQAPSGLLKLKRSGLGSIKTISSLSNLLLNLYDSPKSGNKIAQSPAPSKNAVSIESASLDESSLAALTLILSIIISSLSFFEIFESENDSSI